MNYCFNPEQNGDDESLMADQRQERAFPGNLNDLSAHLLSVADEEKSEDFFHYNVIAFEIREKIKGNLPIRGQDS